MLKFKHVFNHFNDFDNRKEISYFILSKNKPNLAILNSFKYNIFIW